MGAQDLRLYLVCPDPDLMGADPGRRFVKAPRYIDLPSINLKNEDRGRRGSGPASAWMQPAGDGTRITQNLDTDVAEAPQCRSGRS